VCVCVCVSVCVLDRMGGIDWIGLAQDRDNWKALVNAVLKLRVPQNAGKLVLNIYIYIYIKFCVCVCVCVCVWTASVV
jgi:hypothetical protein